jgi:hypothetical protein
VAANEELRDAGCVGRLEEMLALSSVGGQVDVKTRYPRIGVRASERIVGHSENEAAGAALSIIITSYSTTPR